MGTRYFIQVRCPSTRCDLVEDDVYYAPTCGFIEWVCPDCGLIVDLELYTGISYDDASNLTEIEALVDKIAKEHADDQED